MKIDGLWTGTESRIGDRECKHEEQWAGEKIRV